MTMKALLYDPFQEMLCFGKTSIRQGLATQEPFMLGFHL
jgi:hypothetical protein